MEVNNFNRIAFTYDQLAKLVFGRSIIKSQRHFLEKIPDEANVLILGGGTGRIIEEIVKIKPKAQIIFIEASSRMVNLAKAKCTNANTKFILGTEDSIPNHLFEVVITNFYLDLFSENYLNEVVSKIKRSLSPGTIWLATDFVNQKWWHSLFLKLMYLFFRVTCNIEAKRLPDWENSLNRLGAKKLESKLFYRNFIKATVFQF